MVGLDPLLAPILAFGGLVFSKFPEFITGAGGALQGMPEFSALTLREMAAEDSPSDSIACVIWMMGRKKNIFQSTILWLWYSESD